MRFGQVLALSGLAAAIEVPADENQYVALFNGFVANTFGAFLPSPNSYDHAAAEEARTGEMKMSTITFDNWRQTLYDPVQPGATEPEEWWLLVTGRNKTCYGHCLQVESAWNESAAIFAKREDGPHMALLNCDDQPVLCNMWSAGTGIMWVFEMLPPPANITIYLKRLNYTTTTTEDIVNLYDGPRDLLKVHDGAFHPFNGWAIKYHVATPLGYIFWVLNTVPSWAFMLFISFFSRSFMNRGLANEPRRPRAPAAGTAAN